MESEEVYGDGAEEALSEGRLKLLETIPVKRGPGRPRKRCKVSPEKGDAPARKTPQPAKQASNEGTQVVRPNNNTEADGPRRSPRLLARGDVT